MKEIYFDNSATTRPYPQVTDKVVQMLTETYGNPSSLHRLGKDCKLELENARRIIAESLAVTPEEIYFTAGGTEANNLAILGACRAHSAGGNHLVTTTAEHAAVTKPVRSLKRQGWSVDYVSADGGRLDMEALEKAITEETVLVSVMMVNNETGCIFPVREVKQIIKQKRSSALLHCDAVQGYGKLFFDAAGCGADLISVSAHKIHGVKGAGALYVKRGVAMEPIVFGGGQEGGLRSGTESSPLIAAFGEAVRIAFGGMPEAVKRMVKLRDYCLEAIAAEIPAAVLNSDKQGAPHIVNFSLPPVKSQVMVDYMSNKGIYLSGGAACKSNYARGPSVLESLGLSRQLAESALRVSFSAANTELEIERFITVLRAGCREYC